MNNAEHCSDLRVQSSNGEVAQTAESLTLGARDASMLEIDDNAGRAVLQRARLGPAGVWRGDVQGRGGGEPAGGASNSFAASP